MFIKIKISTIDSGTRLGVAESLKDIAEAIENLTDAEIKAGGTLITSDMTVDYNECNIKGE